MSFYNILQNDLKDALKRKDSRTVSVLRMAVSSIKNAELEKRAGIAKNSDISELEEKSKLTDEEITGVLVRESKKRKEAIEGFLMGGKKDMATEEEEEKKIIDKYLPEQLSEEDVNKEIEKIVIDSSISGIKDFGKAMGILMAKLKGRVDGKMAGELLKKKLQQ